MAKKRSSKPPVKKHPKLKRLISRGVRIRGVQASDAKFFYAGYRLGAFTALEEHTDKNAAEFDSWFDGIIAPYSQLITAVGKDDKPLCLVVGNTTGEVMEIHSAWMPWASARNRIEATVAFFKEYNQWYTVVTTVSDAAVKFHKHVARYGVSRFVGELRNINGKDSESNYIFQGVR